MAHERASSVRTVNVNSNDESHYLNCCSIGINAVWRPKTASIILGIHHVALTGERFVIHLLWLVHGDVASAIRKAKGDA